MSKARKETSEFNQASNDMEQPSPAEHGLLAADDEHHVNHDSQGGQEMTRTALATRQDCARSSTMRNDEVSTTASEEITRKVGEHDAHDVENDDPTQDLQQGQVRISSYSGGIITNLNKYKVKLKSY